MASAFSLNRVELIGNLGQDPEMKTTPQGVSYCTFSVATTESYKGQDGNWIENTDWHSVTLWDRLAERAAKNLKKGSKVYIEGRLKHRSYEKDGVTRYVTDIRADNFISMAAKSESGDYSGGGYNQPTSAAPAYQTPQNPSSFAPVESAEFDDDVPF
jgi:single-strand DNA-binding protein